MIPATILHAARSGFALPRGRVRVLSTRFGKVCLAHRSLRGDRLQIRLVRELPDTADRLRSETAWLTHLAVSHRLAVPRPQRWRDGQFVSPALHGRDGVAWRAVVCSWVAGRHLNMGLDATAMRRAGDLIARVHRANVDAPDGITAARPVWWIPRLFTLATTLRDAVQHASAPPAAVSPALAASLRRAHDTLVSAYDQLPVGPAVSGLIHTDAHWQNLRYTQHRVGLVDFEDFATGRFMLDVASLWGKVEARRGSEHLLEAILDGYDRVSPLPPAHARDLDVMLAFRRFDYAGWVLSWPRRDLYPWGPALLRGTEAYIDRHLAR